MLFKSLLFIFFIFIKRSYEADRLVDYIDGSQNMNVQTFKCPSAVSVQFNKQYYGTFKYDSLNDPVPSLNVGYFKFTTSVPHFARDINIDIIYLRGDSQTNMTFRFNQGVLEKQYNLKGNGLQVLCDSNQSFAYSNFEVYYRGRFEYNYSSDGNIIIHLSEEKAFIAEPSFLVSSIQVNINTCHPSCRQCSGPTANECLSCDSSAILANKSCSCKNPSHYFQEGICVLACDNTNGFFKVNPLVNQCEFIKNCKEWDTQKNKCTSCNSSLLIQQNTCVKECSTGFESVINSITKQQECLLQDRIRNVLFHYFEYKNKLNQANQVLSAFNSNEFSGIEVKNISGLTLSNFYSQFGTDAIVSRCGQYQLLGGFYINKLNSSIEYKFTIPNYKYVKATFKYILIDYVNTSTLPRISISLNTSVFSMTLSSQQMSESKDICGFQGKEIIGTVVIISQNIALNTLLITNLENSNPYFGIRELTVYALNCFYDNCSECNSSWCTKCNDKYYLSIRSCVKCPNANCLTCNPDKSNQCLTCSAPLSLSNFDCVSNCGDGMAYNPINNICENCIVSNCMDCKNDIALCNKCESGYFNVGNNCSKTCPDGYYADQNQSLCVKCIQTECISCVSSVNVCSKCNNSYLDLSTSQCVQACKNTQYLNTNGECQNCSDAFDNCIKCNSNVCEQCLNGFFLFNGNCMLSCPSGTASDNVNMICKNCSDSNCNLCSLAQLSNCIYCKVSKFQYNGICLDSCPKGSYPDQDNICQPCSIKYPSCISCSATNCFQCDISSSNNHLNSSKTGCVSMCGQREYRKFKS